MGSVLRETRDALGGRPTILERLSFADIAVAEALAFVRPQDRFPLGPRSRELWTEPDLVASFPDLLAWRDTVLAR
jgi:glutathione S-transferase